MRETGFIEQNREKWEEFEGILREPHKDPDKLSNLFVEITDDLSYARSFYPNRSVRVYLNNISQRIFFSVHQGKRYNFTKRMVNFWRYDLPQLAYESRRELLLSFLVFVLAVGIGVVSTMLDPDFPRLILGDGYVDQTLENIRKGDEMAIYKDPDAAGMALQITWNNLKVALMIFVGGLLFSTGSMALMLFNGIMVGAFQYFFYQQGVFTSTFLTIWIHGTLEMSTMVIAGAAGILLGKGLVFPGTYTRLQAFMLSGRRGLTLMMGIAPLVVLAGFIESFVTRFTDAPYLIRAAFILFSLLFVVGYFGWYARRVARRDRPAEEDELRLPPTPDFAIDYRRVKSAGVLFSDAFVFYRKHLNLFIRLAAGMAVLCTGVLVTWQYYFSDRYYDYAIDEAGRMLASNPVQYIFEHLIGGTMENTMQILSPDDFFDIPSLMNFLLLVVMALPVYHLLVKETGKGGQKTIETDFIDPAESPMRYWSKTVTAIVLGLFIYLLLFQAEAGFRFLLLVFAVPVLLMWMFAAIREDGNIFTAISRGLSLTTVGWARLQGFYLVNVLMGFVLLVLVVAPLTLFYLEIIAWNLPIGEDALFLVKQVFLTYLYFLGIGLSFPLLLLTSGMGYFTLREIKEATSLFEQIPQVGQKRRSFGMEQE